MTDPKDAAAAPAPGTTNWVKITNVYPGDCIGLSASVWVDYSNATGSDATVGLGCGGASSPSDQPAPAGTGTRRFTLTHPSAGAGHALAAALKQRGGSLAGHTVSPVGIGNPCPVRVSTTDRIVSGFPVVDLRQVLTGTFEANRGDKVLVLVEEPATEGPSVPPPALVYAAAAEVNTAGKEATWTHPVIQAARKGHLLRVVLTKDGVVVSAVRAIFD